MTTIQEIINTVQSLPVSEQEKVLEAVQSGLKREKNLQSLAASEDEVEKLLLDEGVISCIPERRLDDEEETYEPVTVAGQPLSEMILESREQ